MFYWMLRWLQAFVFDCRPHVLPISLGFGRLGQTVFHMFPLVMHKRRYF